MAVFEQFVKELERRMIMKLERKVDFDKIITHGNRKLKGKFGPNGYFTNEDSGEIIESSFEN